ncbi:cotH family protein [[Clostridium] bifermentans ATCC 638]|uniref:CotH family protein n=1 Tax=Paraclostridium bifermentans ATCC 638 = DSM 14991 TaxID=1233171 RepID=T4VIC7_PARBF|nr:CotH kinase family protein [Paraclostridium bifermentans]EQK40516.1 cotH family protein [[Clostridium] bifermentans ATCC 638] [Paraclostridium bifermentans ATCC 638 = DSM 14991]RIZ58700.1 spore coat protein CotH [Paraclostridium bifermentans]UAG18142.1 CotH kinase family protein [Paraclostridium bifermentans]
MINDKQSKYISVISIILSVVFIVVSIYIPKNKTDIETISNTEDVLDKNSITSIDIKIKESDWKWLLENATKEEYKSADVIINGETFNNVGIRPKGNSSLTSVANDSTTDRYSIKIDFGQYVDGQTYHGIRKLALNNNISDATYMKEAISYDIYNFLGIATPEYSYTDIKINGSDWGLYLGVEVIDERFIEKNYGEVSGNLYKPETMNMGGNKGNNGEIQRPEMDGNMPEMGGEPPSMDGNVPKDEVPPAMNGDDPNIVQNQNVSREDGDVKNLETNKGNDENNGGAPKMGNKDSQGADLKYIDDDIDSYSILRDSAVFKNTTDKNFKNIIDLTESLKTGKNIENYLNVDEVLKYFAVNTFLVNLDSYSGGMYHNYYLYEKDGVSEILPWDLNMSFGGFAVKDGEKAINFPIDSPVTGNLEDAPLIGKLLENDDYKELYHKYLKQISDNYFSSGTFNNRVTQINKLISNYVKKDATAFYSYEEYKTGVSELLTFGKDRTKSVQAQLNGEQSSTEYGNIATTLNLPSLGQQNMGKNKDINKKEQVDENNKEKPQEMINNGDKNDDKQMIPPNKKSNNQNRWIYYGVSIISLIILLISTIFIAKYKRKRY